MKKYFRPFLLLGVLVLSSCDFFQPGDSTNGGGDEIAVPKLVVPEADKSSANLVKGEGYEQANAKYTTRENMENQDWNTLVTTGDQKILVVPVKFSNGPAWTEGMLNNVNKSFFGQASDTAFESVTSFFYKSSYGRLSLSGEVTKVLNVGMTISAFDSKYKGDNYEYDPGAYMGKLLYNKLSTNKLLEYDQDKDGYVDAAVFVYSNAYSNDADTAYWAWCSYSGYYPNKSKPTVGNYMWASYTFLNDGYDELISPKGLETHTFIHETGHLLGLDDYYCYDQYDRQEFPYYPWDCAGDRDMQAYNIGDHNIYSKFALGWINPYYVTDSCEINLRSSALYGDAILIKNNWNKSTFDEYLLIEYYTPEGLNEQDSKYSLDGRNKMYSGSGLRIYHVDARLIKNLQFDKEGYYIGNGGYSSTYIANNTIIGASNSISYSYLTDDQEYLKTRLLHLIDSGNRNTLSAGINGTGNYGDYNGLKINPNTTLWTKGQTFTATSSYFYNGNNTFNDETKVGYSITVGDTNNGMISVQITKK